MVKVDFSLFILIYFFPPLAVIIYFWVRGQSRRRMRILPPSPTLAFRCPICGYVYLISPQQKFSRCPRCKSINLRGPS